jgi:acylphosphatase
VVTSNADGRLQVFARGTDSALLTMTQAAPSSGVWSAWMPLAPGVPFVGEPAVGINADGGGLLVFARGTDNALWAIGQTIDPWGSHWGSWGSVTPGSAITSDPVVGVNADGRLEVFARGTDNALWTITQTPFPGGLYLPTTWTHLAPGSAITGGPVVGVNADGRLEVFARGTDNALWHIWQTAPDGGWSGWASLGGSLINDPAAVRHAAAVARNADGRLEVFTRGTDNALWHRWQTTRGGSWSGWARLAAGVLFEGEPVAGRNADGRLQVFVQRTDFTLWTMTQTAPGSSTWSAWTPLAPGVPFVGPPVVASNADGRLQVFARDTHSALWTITQIAPNS